jgi:hypothetical protein
VPNGAFNLFGAELFLEKHSGDSRAASQANSQNVPRETFLGPVLAWDGDLPEPLEGFRSSKVNQIGQNVPRETFLGNSAQSAKNVSRETFSGQRQELRIDKPSPAVKVVPNIRPDERTPNFRH